MKKIHVEDKVYYISDDVYKKVKTNNVIDVSIEYKWNESFTSIIQETKVITKNNVYTCSVETRKCKAMKSFINNLIKKHVSIEIQDPSNGEYRGELITRALHENLNSLRSHGLMTKDDINEINRIDDERKNIFSMIKEIKKELIIFRCVSDEYDVEIDDIENEEIQIVYAITLPEYIAAREFSELLIKHVSDIINVIEKESNVEINGNILYVYAVDYCDNEIKDMIIKNYISDYNEKIEKLKNLEKKYNELCDEKWEKIKKAVIKNAGKRVKVEIEYFNVPEKFRRRIITRLLMDKVRNVIDEIKKRHGIKNAIKYTHLI